MKNKLIITIFCFLFIGNNAFCQNWYRNYEKYWWYRYRLVNDFMKVGPNHGESIPAYLRVKGYIGTDPVFPGYLKWTDATQALGHYISATALEHKILTDNNWPSNRSKMENYYGQKAYERLDTYAESYCYDIHGTYPNNGSPGSGDLNGFSIRDDVDEHFVMNNYKHFNRPGITKSLPVGGQVDIPVHEDIDFGSGCGYGVVHLPIDSGVSSDYYGRSWVSPTMWSAGYCTPWTTPAGATTPPQYPVEESLDQLCEVMTGMGLTTQLCGGGSGNYMGIGLQAMAADNIYRSINWAVNGGGSPWTIDNATSSPTHFVYGTFPNFYWDITLIDKGGANIYPMAPAIADFASTTTAPYHSTTAWTISGYSAATIFQTGQLIANGNAMFYDNYVAMSRNWYTLYLPFPLNFAINTSWSRIQHHATDHMFQTPHTPLLYQLYHPGGSTFDPTTFNRPSYISLLDAADFCGNYSYDNEISNWGSWNWSSQDVLSFAAQRGNTNNSDFNGVDYMELFNLYSLVDGNYLQWIINPYYTDSFRNSYPDATGLGSSSKWLKLNYLEYFSAIDTIHYNAHVTFHGAKQIDLLPGFQTEPGAFFTAYVKDIDCRSEDYHYAEKDGPESPQILEYNPTGQPYQKMARIIDSTSLAEDTTSDLDSTMPMQMRISHAETIIQKMKSDGRWEQLLSRMPDSIKRAMLNMPVSYVTSAGFSVSISPNPNGGTFNVMSSQSGHYDVDVLNILGTAIYHATFDGHTMQISLGNAPAGAYTIRATSNRGIVTSKITILK